LPRDLPKPGRLVPSPSTQESTDRPEALLRPHPLDGTPPCRDERPWTTWP
jgi:hypothetical protein